MHVFEVDREGDSIKIWEEIEDRTRALLPRVETTKSAVTAESSVHANAVESMAEQHNHRPELHNKYLPKPQIDYLRDDDLSVQMDESDDTSRLQELREDRDRRTPGAHISIEGLMDDMRTHWFHASNPPKLPSEPAMDTENASHHKKSMRLSEVLNDVEPEQAANEAAPLLGSFHEGNLTAEGRRQVRLSRAAFHQKVLTSWTRLWRQEIECGSGPIQYAILDLSKLSKRPGTKHKICKITTAGLLTTPDLRPHLLHQTVALLTPPQYQHRSQLKFPRSITKLKGLCCRLSVLNWPKLLGQIANMYQRRA